MHADAPLANPSGAQLVQLGPGDLVSVRVYGQPDMDGDVYVADDGAIRVPLLGAVQVGHLSPVEAAESVETALQSHQLLVKPHVTIQLLQSHSQLVSILGEIHTPGRYPINPGTNVIQLLAQAGGETEAGADYVFVLRPGPGGLQRYRINLTGLNDPKDPLSTDALEAGDSVYVPRAQQIYVDGAVRTPGAYRYEPGMTVTEAITHAGGINDRGSRRRVMVRRAGPNGATSSIHVEADDLVQPDDNILVKESLF
jgi:polysaccharide export outer membrane protein